MSRTIIRPDGRTIRLCWLLVSLISIATLGKHSAAEEQIVLKSGLTLQGLSAPIATLNQNPFQAGGAGAVNTLPILMVSDGLRRMYIHRRGMVVGPPVNVPGLQQDITLKQPEPLAGKQVQGIGNILGISPFNKYGRRTITVRGPDGSPLPIFQGITEINSRYAKLIALKQTPSYDWDMRVATSSLASPILQQILHQRLTKQIGLSRQQVFDRRLEIVRFFMEAKRFAVAQEELEGVMRDFPDQQKMDAQLAGIVREQATQLINEANFRASVGQVNYAKSIFSQFPRTEIGRVTLQSVIDGEQRLATIDQQIIDLIEQLRTQVQQLPAAQGSQLTPIVDEIAAGLSAATLPRLSDYSRLGNSETIPLDNRVALAVAGWFLGSGSGEQNLSVAIALATVRDLVREYLGVADAARRQAILAQLKTLEGADIQYVSRMLPLLVPPQAWPDSAADPDVAGLFRIGINDSGIADEAVVAEGSASYVVQLPPEYDPLREYPCILALHAPGDSAENQVEWWAGPYDAESKVRHGHAARNGYIVVAPAWTRPTQRQYEYTPREHQRILVCLRDAMRRCSIDADRVFIVGHGDGGTAAWDIALSHPDHWAGMISITGEPNKTIQHYYPTAQYVPMYLVMGESAGTPPPLIRHGPILDDHMNVRNDAIVVMYLGRGSEYFYEEILDLFEWMNAPTHKRKPTPQEFEAVTMREGDQYFWWLELGPLKPLARINPILWDDAPRKVGSKVGGRVLTENQIRMEGPTDEYTLWLRPDMGIDLNQQVVIRNASTPQRFDFDGSLDVILEDARTRADRKRPFWAKVRVP
ncbi:alpha/beta hydrolase [Stieleria varia]|uniref:Alpha/beta hydrolase family protein n=1 Tax=Stieleria varia TaxID=2528005 RepID=A0A5C6ASD0_9BACT|nr:alpha/beta hydrolase [Stieleria varia]TWU01084.1 Alpha/beta hydrolase family protein [Stieleria varia]